MNCLRLLGACLVVAFFVSWGSAQTGPSDGSKYLVVSFAPQGDKFDQAAEQLIKRHEAQLIRHDISKLDQLLPIFKKWKPRYVAFVTKPDQLDINLAQKILKLSTQIDKDPFVDFAYGLMVIG